MEEWYVIKTRARQESRAQEHLENQGFDVYLPLLAMKHGKEEPLFPGYAFLYHDTVVDLPYYRVRSTRGVSNFLRFGEAEPVKIPCELIDEIKEQEQLLAGQPVFSKGDIVHFRNGPFKEFQGVYLADSGDERSIVLLNFLNRQQKVKVHQKDLKKGA